MVFGVPLPADACTLKSHASATMQLVNMRGVYFKYDTLIQRNTRYHVSCRTAADMKYGHGVAEQSRLCCHAQIEEIKFFLSYSCFLKMYHVIHLLVFWKRHSMENICRCRRSGRQENQYTFADKEVSFLPATWVAIGEPDWERPLAIVFLHEKGAENAWKELQQQDLEA